MPSTIHVNIGWIIGFSITIAFAILYPLVLAIIVRRRLGVSWRYFGYGALIFFLFQIISRVPIVTLLNNVLAPQLRSSIALRYTWLIVLAITAGLFEEVGRYVGYHWLMRREEKTWSKAIMYGIGHGGLESMVLIGGLGVLSLVNVIVLSNIDLRVLPASQHAQVVQQLTAINVQPAWFSLLGAWERLWTMPMHIAWSVIVLQVFRRNTIVWLWVAVLTHALVDFTSVAVLQLLGSNSASQLLVEAIIALFGIIAVVIIWRLRDRPEVLAAPVDQQVVQEQSRIV